jgi:hypothetical protein
MMSHRRFLEAWMQYGVYVHNSSGSDLASLVAAIPIRYRKEWQTALTSESFRRTSIPLGNPINLFASEASLLAVAGTVDLACLEDTRAECLCLNEGVPSKVYGAQGFEVCRYECADQSQSFIRERQLWTTNIPTDENRTEIWRRRFADYTKFSRRIAIIDRYAGKEMVECYGNGEICGLSKYLMFLNKLDLGDQKKKSLIIYVSDNTVGYAAIQSTMTRIIPNLGGNLASAHLYITPDKKFAKQAHNRVVRFDSVVISLDAGMTIFRNEKTGRVFDCYIKTDLDRTIERKIERELQVCSKHTTLL